MPRDSGGREASTDSARNRRLRKKPASSFKDDDFRALYQLAAQRRRPADLVIELLCITGLRIGDVIAIDRRDLERALDDSGVLRLVQKGGHVREIGIDGARDAWSTLREALSIAEARYVSRWLAPRAKLDPYSAAYLATDRRLRELADELGLARAHLHRIRRTVAMQVLEETGGNLVLVQKVLGHTSISTTQRYVDEGEPEKVAAVHARRLERLKER